MAAVTERSPRRAPKATGLIDCDIHPEAFATLDDEVDAPVNLGDVVIFDSRIRHATHANERPEHRESVNMWYIARDFDIEQPYSWQVQ